ncbi:sensor histidine kinase [Halobacterium jilantaiense]|uniref:histidine kinase n=1 Tax=Halobacterium jilantaiense TaxID=355548 RepID=A0A1I0MNQ5_9EURY|nr:sensor histidine kinase [Halobacterium jilantaiense]SEV90104.1 Signal transduction histidine kinase [Halobacterium jilantaiense]
MRSRRIFVVLLVTSAVVLSGATWAGFQAYQDAVMDEHHADVERSGDLVRVGLDARLAAQRQTVELWSGVPAVADHGTDGQRAALDRLVGDTLFSGASVVAANGTMTALVSDLSPADRDAVVGTNFGDRTYVQRAMAGETYVSDPVAAQTGNTVVTVSAPVRHDGEVVATLNAALHLSETEFFDAATGSLDAETGVTVTASDGTVIYERAPSPNTSLTTARVSLSEVPWRVTVSESRASVQPAIRRLSLLQAGSVAAVLAVVAGFGWWNYRRNVSQFEALRDGFEALQNGEYGTHIDVGGPDEWERIGRGFDEMSDTVRRSVDESRERARQLQVLDRVLRHTLRNELNVVRGRAELLADADDPGVAGHAAHIVERCDDLLETAEKERVINQVLDTDTSAGPVDIPHAVERAVETARDDYPDAAIALDAPDHARAVTVPQFGVAVRELVENGIRHADRGPAQVAVDVTADEDVVRVRVTDHGPGIPEMERRVLSGEDAIDELHHSQGLGLWLVHWTVAHSGGDLSFADNDPRGSVVTITLPVPPEGP